MIIVSSALNINKLNELLDFIVPIYLVLVSIISIYFIISSIVSTQNLKYEDKEYVYVPKNKILNEPWKDAFNGIWEQVERKGFYEFLIFNGAPKLIASMVKDSNSGCIIRLKGNIINVQLTGMPSMKAFDAPVADTKEKIKIIPLSNDKNKTKQSLTAGYWWDYKTESLCVISFGPIAESETRRTLLSSDLMLTKVVARKKNGTEVHVTSIYKKKI